MNIVIVHITPNMNTVLAPTIWGPHYWFFLHTIAFIYPNYPNAVTRRKYYELINNFHLFIPTAAESETFSKLIEKYPVTPYLDNRDSIVRWIHFIHNKLNEKLEKPTMSIGAFYSTYYDQYSTKIDISAEYVRFRHRIMYIAAIGGISGIIYYMYAK